MKTKILRFLLCSIITSSLCTHQVHPSSFTSSWFECIQKPCNKTANSIKNINTAYFKPVLNSIQTFCKQHISHLLFFSVVVVAAYIAMSKRKKDNNHIPSTSPNYTIHASIPHQQKEKNFELKDLPVHEQTGDYCGYHAAYNIYHMLLYILGDHICLKNYSGFNEKTQSDFFKDMQNCVRSNWRKKALKKHFEILFHEAAEKHLEKEKQKDFKALAGDVAQGLSNSIIEQLYGSETIIEQSIITVENLIDTFNQRTQKDHIKKINMHHIENIFKETPAITIDKNLIESLHSSKKISPLSSDDIHDLIINLILKNRDKKEVMRDFSIQNIDEYITILDDVSTFDELLFKPVFDKWRQQKSVSHIFLIGDMSEKKRDQEGHWVALLALKDATSSQFYVANSKKDHTMHEVLQTVIKQLTKKPHLGYED